MSQCKPVSAMPTPFMFEEHPIRVALGPDGKPMFVAKDVTEALGGVWKGVSGSMPHVPDQWRGVCSVQTPSGMQEMVALSDQGLWFFLGRSDKPKALPFQMWIAGEVVPSIVTTGSYTVGQPAPSFPVPKSLPEALRLAADLAEQVESQQKQLSAQAPAVKFVEDYVNADNLLGLQETARRLRLPQRKFFQALESDRVCFRKSEDGPLIPYAKFINDGLLVHQIRLVKTQTDEGAVSKDRGQTMVTPAGRVWLAKKYGHMSVPMAEQGDLLAKPASTGGQS